MLMTPRCDDDRRGACGPRPPYGHFLFSPRNQRRDSPRCRQCKAAKETLSMFLTTIHLSPSLYKFHNGQVSWYSRACPAIQINQQAYECQL
jgi:hypothetical protein